MKAPSLLSRNLVDVMGPRLSFVAERGMTDLLEGSLTSLFNNSDVNFAEQTCRCMHEEYQVFKLQWERTYGVSLGWVPPKAR
mmetsp:Transcript_18260/g.54924  ORF Transcript_18260/g.54924 Transcript_18260/m.54924 type:complete len:82 (-) Transcript_18260:1697-1942(-)